MAEDIKQTKDKIEVDKEFLAQIKDIIEKQKSDIEFLKSVADKKAVALYHQRHREAIPPVIKIRAMDVLDEKTGKTVEKVIMGWGRMPDNEVFKQGREWSEKQTVELFYQDGTSEKLSYVDYNRRFRHIPCQQVGTSSDDRTGEFFYHLRRMDTGEEIKINALFVN